MFWVRFRSSVVLMLITIASLVLGGNVLFAVILAISLIGMMELYRVIHINKSFLGFVGYIIAISYFAMIYFQVEKFMLLLFIGFLLLLMFGYVISFPKYKIEDVTIAFFALFM